MKIRRKIVVCLLFCSVSLIQFKCYPQLTLDLGKDTTYCIGLYLDSINIGSNLTVMNGKEPYSFRWKCKIKVTDNLIYTASDFLNDTTIHQPLFIDYLTWPEWIKFTVQVTDAQNNIASDSMRVRFSSFIYMLGYIEFTINQGDSVLLNSPFIGGGIMPLSFKYIPEYGLTNSDTIITWAKPDTSTFYYQIAIDSCGCVSEPNPAYQITVQPTGINDLGSYKKNQLNLRISNSNIYYNNPKKVNTSIKVYSLSGQLIFTSSCIENYFDFSEILKSNNIYIVSVTVGDISDNIKIKIH